MLPLAAWVAVLWLFFLFRCIEGTVNELQVIDCILELTFHVSSDLFLFEFVRRLNISLRFNNNNNSIVRYIANSNADLSKFWISQ